MARGRRSSSSSNRRRFEWARAVGNVEMVPQEGLPGQFGSVDLLQEIRDQYGQNEFENATVTAIKGYVKPIVSAGQPFTATFSGANAIRVAGRTDLQEPTPADSPIRSGSQERWWNWYSPFLFTDYDNTPGQVAVGNSLGTNQWMVDIRSRRVLRTVAETLGLFCGTYQEPATAVSYWVDYHLSIGVLLA